MTKSAAWKKVLASGPWLVVAPPSLYPRCGRRGNCYQISGVLCLPLFLGTTCKTPHFPHRIRMLVVWIPWWAIGRKPQVQLMPRCRHGGYESAPPPQKKKKTPFDTRPMLRCYCRTGCIHLWVDHQVMLFPTASDCGITASPELLRSCWSVFCDFDRL